MKTSAQKKKHQAARNAWRLLFRTDARSFRRCRYWLRQYGLTEFPAFHQPQVPFEMACLATNTDPTQWGELPPQ